jgi:hypothetical protein
MAKRNFKYTLFMSCYKIKRAAIIGKLKKVLRLKMGVEGEAGQESIGQLAEPFYLGGCGGAA